MMRDSTSRPWSSVPRRKPLCPGPTGMPESDSPVLGYCALGPWPMSAVNNGAKIATSTRNTMKPSETMATRSWRSRVQASCHGVRPTMSSGPACPLRRRLRGRRPPRSPRSLRLLGTGSWPCRLRRGSRRSPPAPESLSMRWRASRPPRPGSGRRSGGPGRRRASARATALRWHSAPGPWGSADGNGIPKVG